MKNKNSLPNDVASLQTMIGDLQHRTDQLLQENQQLRAIQQKETSEFVELYRQVTGQLPQPQMTTRDYALSIYNYLNSIISLAPGHIFWLDRNNVYLGCNEEHAKSVGLASRNLIVGKTNADLPWSEQAAALDEANIQVMASGQTLILEETVETVKGVRIYLSAKVPLKNMEGKIIGLLGTALDISEQKEALVAMEVARQKAEEASWAKSEFIQNMSHDLKTPLMTIMGMAELLSASEHDAERKEYLMMIHNAGKRMLDIFTGILDVATLEVGKVEVKKEPIDLREIIQGLQELYLPLIKQKGLYFQVEIADNIPQTIISDSMRVQRILLNLIGNALKFTSEGGVKIKAEMQTDNNQNHLLLSVIDSGIGIPEDKLELIFEKFVRLSSSYENKYVGTGLGLGIVKRFVEDLNGTVKVKSSLDKGTTFICSLDLK